ncbi:phosphatidylethanolamine-binding protein [Pterulicium gracile]|uniref:Phosphatidylethanolamine-binding protein n=1 Tax=Pterulicium gracile TaxID=1884261 RepID=A0A5C3R2H8_9AGAR|nr:phosphatidylethanolamine-binding protein [Pterula gracilis]
MLYQSLITLAVAAFAQAQANTALEIEAIKAHFSGAALVPFLLPEFEPSALLSINYAGVGDMTTGQAVVKEQVNPVPTLTLTPVNSTVELNGDYTVAMVDADIPGFDVSQGVTRHWLINGAKVEDGQLSNVTANTVANYAGPWPAAGSGPHRYVILVFTQPEGFTAPTDAAPPTEVVNGWNFNQYLKETGLTLLAANYIQVEEGESTVSAAATSSVDSATLSAPEAEETGGAPANGANGDNNTDGETTTPSDDAADAEGAGVASTPLKLSVAVFAALFASFCASL